MRPWLAAVRRVITAATRVTLMTAARVAPTQAAEMAVHRLVKLLGRAFN